jgi:hypothetical protein
MVSVVLIEMDVIDKLISAPLGPNFLVERQQGFDKVENLLLLLLC